MSDDDRETKPFKFVTAGMPSSTQGSMRASQTRTKRNIAGKTMSTTTSASLPRERTSLLAASSFWHTDHCAQVPGLNAGTISAKTTPSQPVWISAS
ncbi:hypothetical protein V501_02769 [Pseudogymnoascus sp. VKM F-4519 (FW-2642)]|nr:hypothetical protein V501_02769 [Pseudogymnoascus sp. VKM F-4519 (FW-2642)]